MKTTRLLLIAAMMSLDAFAGKPAATATLQVFFTEKASLFERTSATVVLLHRFKAVLPDPASAVSIKVGRNEPTFTFTGPPPTEDQLRYLANTRGQLRIVSKETPTTVWASEVNIASAELIMSGPEPMIEVQLDHYGAATLKHETAQHIGETLLVTWEGQPVLETTMQDGFGPAIRFAPPANALPQLLLIILRNGHLPDGISRIEIHSG